MNFLFLFCDHGWQSILRLNRSSPNFKNRAYSQSFETTLGERKGNSEKETEQFGDAWWQDAKRRDVRGTGAES
jgi:hypothetical protein